MGDVRVLLAEDNDDIRALVATILDVAGYRTEAYGDGRSALEGSRRTPSELYVLDIQLPGVSGLDVCRYLRSDPATSNSRILLMSAHAGPNSVAIAQAAGADGFLAKPFSRRDLLSRLDELIDAPVPPTA